jgi:SWI/SNF-related matrix-associated actin-dependent regulator of chromatin subfamily B protein 1
MALKTYGDKPISFQIEEGGEFYCVGSEVSLEKLCENLQT